MWDVGGVAQGRTAPYRTHPANTSGRLPLPAPCFRNPAIWDTLEHGEFGAMFHRPRDS